MSDLDTEYTVVETRLPTPRETLYLGMADDSIKQAVPRLNESLSRLITLGTAMAGGALVFLKNDACTQWGRLVAMVSFFFALASAIYGSIPHAVEMKYEVPGIEEAFDKAANFGSSRISVGDF
jgi:hypothetical protein